MKVQPGSANQKKDNSLAVFNAEAASSAVESAGCAYQSPSVIATGADARGVALLSTFTNLVLSVLLIKVPSLVEGKHNLLKRTTVIVATFGSITWIPIVLVMLFFKSVNPLFLTALWVTSLVPTTMLYPLRDNWLASLVPAEKMGRYLSWRSVIAGASYLGTFLLMGYVLNMAMGQRATGANTVAQNPILGHSYAFVLAVAFLASAVSVVLYFHVRPPVLSRAPESKSSLNFITFLKDARKSHLGTFIFFVSVYTFAVNLIGPLFASYMLNDLKFSMMTYTSITATEYVARIISLTFWGKMVDRAGSLKVLNDVTYLIPFVPVLWLFSTNVGYLCAVQMLSGTVWAAFDLCVQTFIYKATPPDQRLRYIVYYRSLTSFSVAIGALTGGLLLSHMFRIFGSQILALFLVSGVLRMAIARVMLPRLTVKGIPDAVIHPELALELAAVPPNSREGLYYHPEVWRKFTQRAAMVGGEILGRTVAAIDPSRSGLFYKPWRWGEFLTGNRQQPAPAEAKAAKPSRNSLFYKPAEWKEYLGWKGIQPAMAESNSAGQPAHGGLYHHPEEWAQFQTHAASPAPRETAKNVSNGGLFHNPAKWGEYLKNSMVLNAATMRTGGEGMVLRQPVFYHPEMWETYKRETAFAAAKAKETAPAAREALLYHKENWEKAGRKTTPARKTTRIIAPREALIQHPDAWEKYTRQTARKSRKNAPAIAVASVSQARIPRFAGKTRLAGVRTTPRPETIRSTTRTVPHLRKVAALA